MLASMEQKPRIIVIVGPTATGKSDLAVELAKKYNGEIISADSRQVYRGLDIGSGKISKKEMRGIPHFLLDIASPKQSYTATKYKRDGKRAIDEIIKRNKLPIIVGGTGFYIDTLVYDLEFPNVKPDRDLRTSLAKKSADELFAMLKKLDKKRARTIDQHNRVRLIRAIEIAKQFGEITPLKTTSPYDPLWIGLTCENTIMKERISERLKKRMKQGMVREFTQLHKNGLSYKRMEALGLEYRYGARLISKQINRKEFELQLVSEIAKYAKRQMTWFKRNKHIHWHDISNTGYLKDMVKDLAVSDLPR